MTQFRGCHCKGDAFFADKPRLWAPTRLAEIGFTPNMDLAPDGKRFAAVMSVGSGQSPQQGRNYVMLVLNFFDEIRRVRGNP